MEPSVFILFTIGFISLFGIVCHFQVLYILKRWQQELIRLETSDASSSSVPWIQRVIQEYKDYKTAHFHTINTISIIDKHFLKEPVRLFGILKTPLGNVVKMLQLLPVTCIICGILGTFLGLTIAMFSMQQTLTTIGTATSDISMNSIVSAISSPFQGMSLAFVTSIAGIASALLLNLFQTGFFSGGTSIPYYQASILADTESLLDHTVANLIKDDKPRDTMEVILDRFSNKVQEAFHHSVNQFAGKMVDLTEELFNISQSHKELLSTHQQTTKSFTKSTYALKEFGDELANTTKELMNIRSGIDTELQTLQQAIYGLEKHLKGSIEKQETGQRRFEQMIQRSDQLLKDSSTKSAEISNLFLKGLEEQMNRGFAKQEEMERRLYQKQEEWSYSLKDNQSQYYHAAQDFSSSVHQLEKAWHDTIERLRRDVIEKMNHSVNRPPSFQQENRELIRTLEHMSERSNNELAKVHQYLTEVYQVLLRMYEQQQYISTRPKQQHLTTRINE
jgi:hypothetical protein